MGTQEVTWRRVLAVWWLIVWRALLGGAVLGFIAGFLVGFIGLLAGLPQDVRLITSGALGALASLIWGIIVLRMALRKTYSDFKIVLTARSNSI
jgi:hypothetical protein